MEMTEAVTAICAPVALTAPERERVMIKEIVFWACKSCGERGNLVMNIAVGDEVCEACGEWQDGVYNDVYMRVG
jgi:hypothetical protein